MKLAFFISVMIVASTAFSGDEESGSRVKQPYERYATVVDRQMFGPLPPGFDPTKPPNEVSKTVQKELTKEQEKLQSAIRFSMINLTPDGNTAVGFTDNSDPKTPVSYYLKVGEERNGWKVLEADAVKATMRIAKGDIEVSLTIGGNSASGGATARSSSSPSPSVAPPPGSSRPPEHRSSLLSLRQRRTQKDNERWKKMEEERAKRAEAEKAERDAEREAEREEQRQQLNIIREELRQEREARQANEARKEMESSEEKPPKEEPAGENDDAE